MRWSLLVLAQWAAVGVFVAVVRHNGWLFYHGGDETFFYTDAWSLAHGHIPESEIGWGLSYLLAPLARIAGPSFLAALPAIIIVQTVVLLPVALLCVYAIGARIAGPLCGYVSAGVWIAAPFVVIPLFDARYHAKYVEQFLPQSLGLTGLGDFPSTVCLLLAALVCVWAIDGGDPADAALARDPRGVRRRDQAGERALPRGAAARAAGRTALARTGRLRARAASRPRRARALEVPRARSPPAPATHADRDRGRRPVRRIAFDFALRAASTGAGCVTTTPNCTTSCRSRRCCSRLPLLGFSAASLPREGDESPPGGLARSVRARQGIVRPGEHRSGTLLRLSCRRLPPFAILVACAPFLFVRRTTEAHASRRVPRARSRSSPRSSPPFRSCSSQHCHRCARGPR